MHSESLKSARELQHEQLVTVTAGVLTLEPPENLNMNNSLQEGAVLNRPKPAWCPLSVGSYLSFSRDSQLDAVQDSCSRSVDVREGALCAIYPQQSPKAYLIYSFNGLYELEEAQYVSLVGNPLCDLLGKMAKSVKQCLPRKSRARLYTQALNTFLYASS